MAQTHKEMSHILGLVNYVPQANDPDQSKIIENTGLSNYHAVESICRRHNKFKLPSTRDIKFELLSLQDPDNYEKEILKMNPGEYRGLAANWDGHAYSIHIIKDQEKTTFVYINRGERHKDSLFSPPTAFAFSLEKKDDVRRFAKDLLRVASSDEANNRKNMASFLDDKENKKFYDKALSKDLSKKDQKTGNCAIANANIAWQFQRAAEIIKSQDFSLDKAYEIALEDYQDMRLKDRVAAVKFLLDSADQPFCMRSPNEHASQKKVYTEANYRYNYLQAIGKLAKKNDMNYMKSLVKECSPKELEQLVTPLLENSFAKHVNEYINDRKREANLNQSEIKPIELKTHLETAKKRILENFGPRLSELSKPLQEKTISQDITFLKYASKDIQTEYLNKDFDKHCLYASKEVRETYYEYKILDQNIKNQLNQPDFTKVLLQTVFEIPKTGRQVDERLEKIINNQIGSLYSYIYLNKTEKALEEFKQLCIACSMTPESRQWLIKALDKKTPDIMELIADKLPMAGVKNVQEIIADPFSYVEKVKKSFKDVENVENMPLIQKAGQSASHDQIQQLKQELSQKIKGQQQLKQTLIEIKEKPTFTENMKEKLNTKQVVNRLENNFEKEISEMITKLDNHIKKLERSKSDELSDFEDDFWEGNEEKNYQSKTEIIEKYDKEIEEYKERRSYFTEMREKLKESSLIQQQEEGALERDNSRLVM